MTIDKNDPKLTAYVLGELSEDETKEVQTAIQNDAELQTEVETIRQTVAQIETVMKDEPLPNKINANPKRRQWFSRIGIEMVAASLLCLICFGAFFAKDLIFEFVDIVQNSTAIPSYNDVAKVESVISGVDVEPVPTSMPVIVEEYNEGQRLAEQEMLLRAKTDESKKMKETSKQQSAATDKSGGNGVKKMEESLKRQSAATPMNLLQYAAEPQGDALQKAPQMERQRTYSRKDLAAGKSLQVNSERAAYGDAEIVSERMEIEKIENRRALPVNKEEKKADDSFNNEKNETYKNTEENSFKPVKVGEFSTFSIDVDTAAYSTMRRFIQSGQKVPEDSVRIEEFINYFSYDYQTPKDGKPFAVHTDIAKCPWESKHLLARIGIKGKEYSTEERPPLNLVFLIDISGSMLASNRLPLVIKSLTELVEMLQGKDHIAIVTYAGVSKVALPSVSGNEKRAILDSLNSLTAGGSTAGAAGIKTAYETARKYLDKKGQNRVILCTDGDFNVGETDNSKLETMIADEAKSGVFLTILGFGMGNYKDERLKTLSMKGNGNYGYIDTPEEARKLLVEGLTGTLFAIAKDVKIQVDFNPAKIAGYRLIGYENRKLRDEDFHNDKVDAGEIGAGHTVTALYELVPAGVAVPQAVDKSRYASTSEENLTLEKKESTEHNDELLLVKLRYKEPDGNKSSLLEYPVKKITDTVLPDFQFASGTALFGMLLRNSQHSGDGTFDSVLKLCEPNTKDDKYRKELIELVKKAKEL